VNKTPREPSEPELTFHIPSSAKRSLVPYTEDHPDVGISTPFFDLFRERVDDRCVERVESFGSVEFEGAGRVGGFEEDGRGLRREVWLGMVGSLKREVVLLTGVAAEASLVDPAWVEFCIVRKMVGVVC